MFPTRYFPARAFAPRYFPKVGSDSAPLAGGVFTALAPRVFRPAGTARVFTTQAPRVFRGDTQ